MARSVRPWPDRLSVGGLSTRVFQVERRLFVFCETGEISLSQALGPVANLWLQRSVHNSCDSVQAMGGGRVTKD